MPAPLAGLLRGAGSYLLGILKIFTRPAALLGVLLFAGLWFILYLARDSGSDAVDILSALTFANGMTDRGPAGIAGGMFGMGATAAAWLSVFSGGIGKTLRGIAGLFPKKGDRRGFFPGLFGFIAGAAGYVFMAGLEASAESFMPGIAGCALSLQAIGAGQGRLYALAQSLTSKKTAGVRQARDGKAKGFLSGLALGFAAGAVLGAAGIAEVWL